VGTKLSDPPLWRILMTAVFLSWKRVRGNWDYPAQAAPSTLSR
jgi:hypothetical protein